MSRGEEKAKRVRFTIRNLFGLVTVNAIAIGLFCLPTYPWFPNYDIVGDLNRVGLFSIGGTIGGFCGHVWRGTALAYGVGFAIGGLVIYAIYALVFLVIVMVYGVTSP